MKALNEFGISGVNSIIRIEDKEMWLIDDKYFMKTYVNSNCLQRVLLMYDKLYHAGVPVAVYNKTKTGELYVKFDDLYYTLVNKAAGSHIDYLKEADLFSFGQDTAKLHNGLKELTAVIKIQCEEINVDFIKQLDGWKKEIKDKNLDISKEIIDYCMSFDELYYKLPRHIIHRDLHGGNMLFENGKLSAFIDFDISEINARLFDICYTMDFGVGNNISDEVTEKWLESLKIFLSGYNSVSELTNEEIESLPYMFVSVQLLTTAFFSHYGKPKDFVDRYINYLNWLYDNRNRFFFSRQDICN